MTAADHLKQLVEAIAYAAEKRKGIASIEDEAESKIAVEAAREAWSRVVALACDAADFIK